MLQYPDSLLSAVGYLDKYSTYKTRTDIIIDGHLISVHTAQNLETKEFVTWSVNMGTIESGAERLLLMEV